jgi:hypothetical protein
MCEHLDPPCPREYDIREISRNEPEEYGVPMVLMLENRLVQKVLRNGDVITETEVVPVLREAPPAMSLFGDLSSGGDTGEEDIPF